MQIIPMRDLKNTVEVERRCAEENGPVYVTKNGYGRLVVMDIEYYERTMKKMYEAKALIDGIADIDAGLVAGQKVDDHLANAEKLDHTLLLLLFVIFENRLRRTRRPR